MTLSPDMPLRAALWRVSSADRSPNCKIGVSGDSLFHANGVSNGRMRQRDRAFDGGAWSNRAVRGRRARMNRGTERSGKPRGSIEAHTFACCPPEHFSSAWRNVKTHGDESCSRMVNVRTNRPANLIPELPRQTQPIGHQIAGSNPAALTTFAVSTPEGRGRLSTFVPPTVDTGYVVIDVGAALGHTPSRYQSRPDCNPLPSRSSRHSIVTFHPQVQQSTSIPTSISLDRLSFMITSLTKEQSDRFHEFIDKWTRIGLSTEPADRPRAESALRAERRNEVFPAMRRPVV